MSDTGTPESRRVVASVLADVASILVFVTVGRRNHQEGITVGGVIETAAPFLLALAVAWLAARVWQRPSNWRMGVAVWVIVMVVGMALRNLVFGSGIATSFMVVAGAFLAFTLVGWRLAAHVVADRSTAQPAASSVG